MGAENGRIGPPGGAVGKYGQGCPTTGTLSYWINPHHRALTTACLFYLYGKPHTASPDKPVPMIDIMGLRQYPNPIHLSFMGASGCYLYIDIVATRAGMTAPQCADTYSIWGLLPDDPALLGGTFYNQWFTLHPSYNTAGLGNSRAVSVTLASGRFGGTCQGFYIYNLNYLGGHLFTGDEGAANMPYEEAIPVMELTYQ